MITITEMPQILIDMLSDAKFDFTTLTWEKHSYAILSFWIFRFGRPSASLHSALDLLSEHNPVFYSRMCEAILFATGKKEVTTRMYPYNSDTVLLLTEQAKADAEVIKPLFDARNAWAKSMGVTREHWPENAKFVFQLTNFNEREAMERHGGWSADAKNMVLNTAAQKSNFNSPEFKQRYK